jgi:hypothetical protein
VPVSGHRGELADEMRTAYRVACDVLEAVLGLPGVVDRVPREDGSTPAALIPSLPRLAWTVTSTNFPDDAEWTQASHPAVRNPVSSKCTTSQAMRCWPLR